MNEPRISRRGALQALLALAASLACQPSPAPQEEGPGAAPGDRLVLSDARWRELLPAPAYAVLRREATEPPRSSPLDHEKRTGTFVCAGCFQPLFRSDQKFDSGTGWPSFFDVMPGAVGTKLDTQLFSERTEYHCSRCQGHQGHVFDDGPPPTGLRYCNNGLALRFVPEGEPLPGLRQQT